jgi:hypothetical protein
MALAAAYWLLMVTGRPSYGTAMLPALVLMGISGGLSQARHQPAPPAPAARRSMTNAITQH